MASKYALKPPPSGAALLTSSKPITTRDQEVMGIKMQTGAAVESTMYASISREILKRSVSDFTLEPTIMAFR